MTRMTGGRAVARALAAERVRCLFELPGSHTLYMYDALREEKTIRRITVRYEGNASFMADTIGRLTGEPGVCLVTAGPGATNSITGVATAYASASPMIHLSGATPLEDRVNPFHGVDDPYFLEKIFRPVTKLSTRIDSASKTPDIFSRAFATSKAGRKGPVHVSLPISFGKRVAKVPNYRTAKIINRSATEARIRRLKNILENAKKPIVCLGEEATHLHTADITRLAEKLSAPVISTMEALGTYPQNHYLFAGYLDESFRQHPVAVKTIETSDCALIIGLRPGSPSARFLSHYGPAEQVFLNEEPVPTSLESGYLVVTGSVSLNTHSLAESISRSSQRSRKNWLRGLWLTAQNQMIRETSRLRKTIHPGYAMAALVPFLQEDCILAGDVGSSEIWLRDCVSVWHKCRHLFAGQYGGMGFGLPAGIAGQLLFPERQVVSVVGDGGLLMSLGELATIAQYALNLKIIVLNDSRYGMIWQFQRQQFRGRYASVNLSPVDFARIARAFGVKGLRVENPEDLKKAYKELFVTKGAGLLDIVVDPDVPYLF